jgi:tellurite methyltransferase
MPIGKFFDELYRGEARYWWRGDNRYATDADEHPTSLVTQMTLRLLQEQTARPATETPLRALDLGAGEGADSIRLALLGYAVDAVEISEVGAKKISDFASAAGVQVKVRVADVRSYEPCEQFDVVICNGVLHYIDDKAAVVERMQQATRAGGLNVVSLWSTHSLVPECHEQVPIYCDDEDGIVVKLYQAWDIKLKYFERDKPESSHSGMPHHAHSHIKMIARKTELSSQR